MSRLLSPLSPHLITEILNWNLAFWPLVGVQPGQLSSRYAVFGEHTPPPVTNVVRRSMSLGKP